jgi:hypothetical protein
MEVRYTSSQLLHDGCVAPEPWVVDLLPQKVLGQITFFVGAENLFDIRQTVYAPVVIGGSMNPRLSDVWAPIEGRVVKTHFIFSFIGIIMFIPIVAENPIFVMHAAVFGLLPLAHGIGEGSQMQQPLAIAVIGGFSISSLLLFFCLTGALPTLQS